MNGNTLRVLGVAEPIKRIDGGVLAGGWLEHNAQIDGRTRRRLFMVLPPLRNGVWRVPCPYFVPMSKCRTGTAKGGRDEDGQQRKEMYDWQGLEQGRDTEQ